MKGLSKLIIIIMATMFIFTISCGNKSSGDPVEPPEEQTLDHISVNTSAVITRYDLADGGDYPLAPENLDLTGLVVTAHYIDPEETRTIDAEDYTVDTSAYDEGKDHVGSYTIIVSYKTKQAQFLVTVIDSSLPVAATPEATPAAGEVTSGTTIELSCADPADAVIHYTINGSEPTIASPVYSDPIPITAAITIRAIAVKEGYNPSSILEAAYTIVDDDDGTINVPGTNLAEKFQWLNNSANIEDDTTYIIEVTDTSPVQINRQTLSSGGKSNIIIQLKGSGEEKVLTSSSIGNFFTVEDNVILILENGITLNGMANNGSLVWINAGGELIMKPGSKLTGNGTSTSGGGVYVNGGDFIMEGGEITHNTAHAIGGGVYIYIGSFNMAGGEIISNEASGNEPYNYGGGVYSADGGVFTMTGGTIGGNIASNYGGGVAAYHMTKTFGIIYGKDEGDNSNKVTAGSNKGDAVQIIGGMSKFRETTAGEGIPLDSSINGEPGGWEHN